MRVNTDYLYAIHALAGRGFINSNEWLIGLKYTDTFNVRFVFHFVNYLMKCWLFCQLSPWCCSLVSHSWLLLRTPIFSLITNFRKFLRYLFIKFPFNYHFSQAYYLHCKYQVSKLFVLHFTALYLIYFQLATTAASP